MEYIQQAGRAVVAESIMAITSSIKRFFRLKCLPCLNPGLTSQKAYTNN